MPNPYDLRSRVKYHRDRGLAWPVVRKAVEAEGFLYAGKSRFGQRFPNREVEAILDGSNRSYFYDTGEYVAGPYWTANDATGPYALTADRRKYTVRRDVPCPTI